MAAVTVDGIGRQSMAGIGIGRTRSVQPGMIVYIGDYNFAELSFESGNSSVDFVLGCLQGIDLGENLGSDWLD